MPRQIITPANVHRPTGYSHAVRVGDTVYAAGQIALDPQGQLVGVGDFVAQAEQAFRNLQVGSPTPTLAVGGTCSNGENLRSVGAGHALPRPEFLVEIEAIAVVAEERGRR